MPLDHGYGVLLGTKSKYYRDPENNYGQYFHGNVEVKTPAGLYHCAIDVDAKGMPNGVQWRVVPLEASMLKGVEALGDGWHSLACNATSGALDYIRNADLRGQRGCLLGPLERVIVFVRRPTTEVQWKSGDSKAALADLEPLLENPKRLIVFGEPFTDGLGVHNIHQNQGDPIGGGHDKEDGIWQDGGTIVQLQSGSYVGFFNKFKTQSDQTDDLGRPV